MGYPQQGSFLLVAPYYPSNPFDFDQPSEAHFDRFLADGKEELRIQNQLVTSFAPKLPAHIIDCAVAHDLLDLDGFVEPFDVADVAFGPQNLADIVRMLKRPRLPLGPISLLVSPLRHSAEKGSFS